MVSPVNSTALGYAWLAEKFSLNPIPHFVESRKWDSSKHHTQFKAGRVLETYPKTTKVEDSILGHVVFALKKEGLQMPLLRVILPSLDREELVDYVKATPTGAIARKLWCLYEMLVDPDRQLPLPDLAQGNYIDLLDADKYYTGPNRKMQRYRMHFNLIGNIHFSPMLRRSEKLVAWEKAALGEKCLNLVKNWPADFYRRALNYLYHKETKSSNDIEREAPSKDRMDRFVFLLKRAGEQNYFDLQNLVTLQNAIVDPRYAATGWRAEQNWVGASSFDEEEVHLIPPKPGSDLEFLMTQWKSVAESLVDRASSVPPVAVAAIVSYLFVYFHPFLDGNGRIHRFLIHHVLSKMEFGPEGMAFPVSAVMLGRMADYDASLESFSVPLLERTKYDFDGHQRLTVTNETLDHFRYIDCTPMAEALYSFVNDTIETELPRELAFLQSYENARVAMREIVDMPEPQANRFVKFCRQNDGRISKNKRSFFPELTDEEIAQLEEAIQVAYGN